MKNDKEKKERKRKITVRSAKQKGMNFQKKVCSMISDCLEIPWSTKDDALISPRPGGQHGVDVILRGLAEKLFKFSCEIKSTESWSLPKTIKQARSNQKKGTDILIFLKRKEYKESFVLMESKIFFELFKKSLKVKEK